MLVTVFVKINVTSWFSVNFGFDFISQNKAKKQLKTFISDFEKNFHVGNAYVHTKPLSHAGCSTVTKPIFSNGAKRRLQTFYKHYLYHFTEILPCPPFTILQRFYGDEITKDNLYKCDIYKDFVNLLVSL